MRVTTVPTVYLPPVQFETGVTPTVPEPTGNTVDERLKQRSETTNVALIAWVDKIVAGKGSLF